MIKITIFPLFVIFSLTILIFANNSDPDLPPGVSEQQWLKISENFGFFFESSLKHFVTKYDSKKKLLKNEKTEMLNGVFMVKKNDKWYTINTQPSMPRIMELNNQ